MAGMLDDLVAQGLVPPQVLEQMEAARAPQLGWSRAGGGAVAPFETWRERPQEAPKMSDFQAGPVVPTVSDLYPDPNMAASYLRHKGIDTNRWQPWQVPLQGDDLKLFREREKDRLQTWQTRKAADLYQQQERRMSEAERHNRAMEAARLAEEKRKLEPKPLTAKQTGDLTTSLQYIDMAQQALDLLEGKQVSMEGGVMTGDRAATGLKGYIPDPILQRIDPRGVNTRAAIANVSSLRAAQRSGGQIPVHEWERIRGFIPTATDDPKVARDKLRQFLGEYRTALENSMTAFTETKIPTKLKSEVERRLGRKRPPLKEIFNR